MASPVFVSPFLYKLTDVCHSSTFSYDIAHEVGPAHFTFRLKFHTMQACRSQGESPSRTQLVALWVFIMRTVTSACIVANGPPTAALALMSHYGRVSTHAPWLRFIDADEANVPQYADTDFKQQDGLPTAVGSSDALVCTPLRQFKRHREETSHVATPSSPATSSTSTSSRRTPRVQAKLTASIADGTAAVAFRSSGKAGRKWLSVFISERWGAGQVIQIIPS